MRVLPPWTNQRLREGSKEPKTRNKMVLWTGAKGVRGAGDSKKWTWVAWLGIWDWETQEWHRDRQQWWEENCENEMAKSRENYERQEMGSGANAGCLKDAACGVNVWDGGESDSMIFSTYSPVGCSFRTRRWCSYPGGSLSSLCKKWWKWGAGGGHSSAFSGSGDAARLSSHWSFFLATTLFLLQTRSRTHSAHQTGRCHCHRLVLLSCS